MASSAEDNLASPPASKKAKTAEELLENIHDSIKDLSSFKISAILQNNTNRKSVCLRGTFEDKEGDAVVLLEKTAFSEENLQPNSDYFTSKSYLEKVFHNDIYGDYKYFPKLDLNSVKATIIHPASEKHLSKYSTQKIYMIDESPTVYQDVVLPHILSEQLSLQWVYNILEKKQEADRIVFEDTDPTNGFVLIPDLKWNGENETLYLLAITHRHNIKSIRDLTDEHLPLLKNIRDQGCSVIKSKYGLDSSQLRIYFHYQPTFYHLHVHFSYLRHDPPGILTEKAHLLSNVISNIELLPDYYKKVTIPYAVKENDKLFKKLVDNNVLKV